MSLTLVCGASGRGDGEYFFPETPEMAANLVMEVIKAGSIIIGGGYGTAPEHIKAIKEAVENHK